MTGAAADPPEPGRSDPLGPGRHLAARPGGGEWSEQGRGGPSEARRIAIVNWRDPWHPAAGGAERYAWELARRFAAGGAEVCFVAGRAHGQTRRDRVEGVELVRFGGRFTVYPLVLAWMLAHRRSFDAVLDCQNGIPFFTPWVLPRRVPVLCVVHHVHDDQFGMYFPGWLARFGRFLEGPVARRAYRRHACVAVSPSTVRAMRERLAWTGPIYVVPNGVTPPETPGDAPLPGATRDRTRNGTAPEGTEPEGTTRDRSMPEEMARGGRTSDGTAPDGARPDGTKFDGARPEKATREGGTSDGTAPGGERSHPAAPGGAAELVCVSRLVPHKRVVELLDVAERLRVRVHVIGRGPEGAALRAQIDRRGLAGLVVPHGYLPEADKNALVAGARLHLCASRGEGWGLSVTEAAALGVPTVAYDVDGLRDAVLDGVTGWLARDGEHLADVVERALKELADPARRRDVAAACRAWAAEFGWARSAGRMAALLDASVRRGGSGRPEGAALPDAVVVRYGDVERVVEGPVRDETLARLGAARIDDAAHLAVAGIDATRIKMRPATELERLLGRTGRWT